MSVFNLNHLGPIKIYEEPLYLWEVKIQQACAAFIKSQKELELKLAGLVPCPAFINMHVGFMLLRTFGFHALHAIL